MDKELKDMVKIGTNTNIILKRTNRIIIVTNIINILTIVVIIMAVLK